MDKLEMIKKVMKDLLCEMEEGPDDFDERLGKKKPKVEVEVMDLGPGKMGDDSSDDSSSGYASMDDDENEGKNFDDLSERIAEMKRKKRG